MYLSVAVLLTDELNAKVLITLAISVHLHLYIHRKQCVGPGHGYGWDWAGSITIRAPPSQHCLLAHLSPCMMNTEVLYLTLLAIPLLRGVL